MGLKPRLPAPKPRTATHDWGARTAAEVTERDTETVPPAMRGQEAETPADTTPPGSSNVEQHTDQRPQTQPVPSALPPQITLSLLTVTRPAATHSHTVSPTG